MCAHEKSNHPIQTSLNTESHMYHTCHLLLQFLIKRSFPTSIEVIRKNDTTPSFIPFHPLPLLFSPRQDKLETRVSTLFPCTGLCVWNNVSTLSRVQELSCKSISEGCFRAGESQLVKRLLLPTPAPSAGTRPASSSSRSCRAFQITGISARVGINIEIFLWATNRRYWKTYPPPPPPFFFFRVPSSINFRTPLSFIFLRCIGETGWKGRWIVGAWRFKWFLIKRSFSFFFIVVIFFTLFIGIFLGWEWN